MLHKEQVKELSRKYLEGEISEYEFFEGLMSIMYADRTHEFTKWMSEQLLVDE